jgi:hypothetical protein
VRGILALITLICILSLLGCSKSSQPMDYDYRINVESDWDVTWNAIHEFFRASNLPVESSNKARGKMISSWVAISDATDRESPCMNCIHDEEGGVITWGRGRFNVLLHRNSDGTLELCVACEFKTSVSTASTGSIENRRFPSGLALSGDRIDFSDLNVTEDCTSTGHLEALLISFVTAKVCGEETPDVPDFRPDI